MLTEIPIIQVDQKKSIKIYIFVINVRGVVRAEVNTRESLQEEAIFVVCVLYCCCFFPKSPFEPTGPTKPFLNSGGVLQTPQADF